MATGVEARSGLQAPPNENPTEFYRRLAKSHDKARNTQQMQAVQAAPEIITRAAPEAVLSRKPQRESARNLKFEHVVPEVRKKKATAEFELAVIEAVQKAARAASTQPDGAHETLSEIAALSDTSDAAIRDQLFNFGVTNINNIYREEEIRNFDRNIVAQPIPTSGVVMTFQEAIEQDEVVRTNVQKALKREEKRAYFRVALDNAEEVDEADAPPSLPLSPEQIIKYRRLRGKPIIDGTAGVASLNSAEDPGIMQ